MFGALLPCTSSSITRTWAGDTAEGCAWFLLMVMISWYFQHFISEVCSLEKLWVCLHKKWSLNTSQDLVSYCRGIVHGSSCYYLSQFTEILVSSGNTGPQHFDSKHSFALACGVRAERNRDGKINETSVAKVALLESQDVSHIFGVTWTEQGSLNQRIREL